MRKFETMLKLTLGATLLVASATSTLAQSNWETVDSVVYPEPGPSAHFTDLAAANDGNIYAVGYDVDTAGNIESSWLRRSEDGGTTWTTVDQFPSQDMGAGLLDLAVSPTDGSIYVVGRIYETLTRKTGQYVSLVRRGVSTSTGGVAWTNVDRVIANPYSVLLRSLAVDGYGRVFVAGHDYNNGGWLVRASIDGVAPYVTTDVFAPGSPAAVVADPANNVFVAGRGGSGAIIRRLAAPTQP